MKSTLYAVIKSDVKDAIGDIQRKAIEPWVFFNSHGVNIEKAEGGYICIKGVEFSGSAQNGFWGGFASNHIRKAGKEIVENTRKKAIERGVSVEIALTDCHLCLSVCISKLYRKMSEIDQRLRGKGYPESVSRRDVADYIARDLQHLNSIIDSEIASASEPIQTSSWWHNFFELKPNICGLGLNLNFFIEWVTKKKRTKPSNQRANARG